MEGPEIRVGGYGHPKQVGAASLARWFYLLKATAVACCAFLLSTSYLTLVKPHKKINQL